MRPQDSTCSLVPGAPAALAALSATQAGVPPRAEPRPAQALMPAVKEATDHVLRCVLRERGWPAWMLRWAPRSLVVTPVLDLRTRVETAAGRQVRRAIEERVQQHYRAFSLYDLAGSPADLALDYRLDATLQGEKPSAGRRSAKRHVLQLRLILPATGEVAAQCRLLVIDPAVDRMSRTASDGAGQSAAGSAGSRGGPADVSPPAHGADPEPIDEEDGMPPLALPFEAAGPAMHANPVLARTLD